MKTRIASTARPILIADDFSEYSEIIREYALENGFQSVEHMGRTYHNVGLCNVQVADLIAEAVGFPVTVDLQFFRLGLAGDIMTNWVHADTADSDWACVWHLSDPGIENYSGTGFFRHVETGWEGIPIEGIDQPTVDMINDQGNDASAWQVEEFVQMRHNRAVFYPTRLFHARYPHEAFGDNPRNGRLIWCAFFRENHDA